jgi:hypothetical protein
MVSGPFVFSAAAMERSGIVGTGLPSLGRAGAILAPTGGSLG